MQQPVNRAKAAAVSQPKAAMHSRPAHVSADAATGRAGSTQGKSLAGERTHPSSRSNRSSSSSSGTGTFSLHSDMSVKEVISYTRCVLQLYRNAEDLGKHEAVRELAPLVLMHFKKMLTAGRQFAAGVCSSRCSCADYTSTMRQLVRTCTKAVSAARATT